jgi:Asp-tRNA(Asn)/Glu-tRNA(Gln) amidotransferase A subunit family amidase
MTTPYLTSRSAFLAGTDTPRAFLERCLDVIERREHEVRAFAHLDIAGARASADAASERYQRGAPLSAVDGMPVGIKDVFDTKDMPTEMGSPIFAGRKPTEDAAHVAALRQGGAVIVGKTVTSQFAVAGSGPTRNPLNLDRTPGETSSGSAAAVCAGMLSVATGSQARGSILKPASFCGIYGIKPTRGALNRWGTLWPNKSYDHLGALAASLDDLWAVLWHIAQVAGGDPGYPGLFGEAAPPPAEPLRHVAVLRTAGWETTTPSARAAFEAYLETLQKAGVTVSRHTNDAELAAFEDAATAIPSIWLRIAAYENRWPIESFRHRAPELLAKEIVTLFDKTAVINIPAYRAALAERATLTAQYDALATKYDAFITLSAEGAATPFPGAGSSAFHELATIIGAPSISVPALEADGMPLGVQLIGRRDGDYVLVGQAREAMRHAGAPASGAGNGA